MLNEYRICDAVLAQVLTGSEPEDDTATRCLTMRTDREPSRRDGRSNPADPTGRAVIELENHAEWQSAAREAVDTYAGSQTCRVLAAYYRQNRTVRQIARAERMDALDVALTLDGVRCRVLHRAAVRDLIPSEVWEIAWTAYNDALTAGIEWD